MLPISKSAVLLKNTYELYAKMLAVENIKVVFDEAITAPAQFDIINRVLYISPVHSAQAHLIPGLVVHEVGHALFSLLSADEAKKLKKITRLLNIIDDGYQERMTCKKHPNAKKHLFAVFDEFFLKLGDEPYKNPNKLVTITNILNFNCKGFKHSHSKPYPSYVLPEDIDLLKQAEMINLDSLMDRWEFSKVLAKALKKYGEMKEDDTDLNSKDQKDGDKPSTNKEDSGDKEESDDSKKPDKGKKPSTGNDEDELEDMLDDVADELNDHHEKFKHQMDNPTSYELPTGKELLQISEIRDIYEKGCALETTLEAPEHFDQLENYKSSIKEAKKIANKIFTQFNMRVQASNLSNTRYKNSGMLDPERAALYQVYDDVFMKTTIEPQQQNHAYSIVLDWSGSMNSSVYALMLRIMELVYFAKSANVEVEVWLYTTSTSRLNMDGIKNNVALVNSKFIQVLNTKRHQQMELDQRIKALWITANQISGNKITGTGAARLKHLNTGGTNVLEGLILGHHVLSKMEADKKTCFILSDGDDSGAFDFYYNAKKDAKQYNSVQKCNIYLNGMNVDALYKGIHTRASASKAISDMYKSIGQNTTGIAWNCAGNNMKFFCDTVIKGVGANSKGPYIFADNLFINEIIKKLL